MNDNSNLEAEQKSVESKTSKIIKTAGNQPVVQNQPENQATAENNAAAQVSRPFLLGLFLEFVAAIAFLTRFPVARNLEFTARDVGRATIFFPLVGAAIGVVQAVALLFFQSAARDDSFRSALTAILLIVVYVFATGALHLDGLADMADGFGGARTKERTLEIMRDSVIGSYGATALILILLLKTTAIATLIFERRAIEFLIFAPAVARWASVPLGKFMNYARNSGGLGQSITDFVGWRELIGATAFVVLLIFLSANKIGTAALFAIVVLVTVFNAVLCQRKIGGVTGDTMGANTEICETAVFVAAVFLRV